MSKTFDFDPDFWFQNRALRGCSPPARGLWVDLLALMHAEGGYLTVQGQPIDDAKLSRMVGEPVASIRKWIKELGEAGIFSVTDDGRMFSSRMVRRAQFSEQAKKHGAEGQRRKRDRVNVVPAMGAAVMSSDDLTDMNPIRRSASTLVPPSAAPVEPTPVAQPRATAKRPAPWWKTPAGWARHGLQQALPMQNEEVFEDYQCRLGARIPPGPHLDELTPRQLKLVERLRPKDPEGKFES